MAESLIASRFRGPPSSGNGGYVAGLLGARIRGAARVRLHAPPPLDRPLAIVEQGETILLNDGETLVASATAAALALEVPPPPCLDEAREAARRCAGFARHPFASCFVCGPDRAEGDGLRIFPGATKGGTVAAPFAPPADLATNASGLLEPPLVWAALDCTGYFAIVGDRPVPMLLGEITVELRGPVDRGPHVAFGWSLGDEGRKSRCGTALASADGRILAAGLATWIRPRERAEQP